VRLHFALVRVQCTLGVTLKFLYHLNQVVAAMKRFDRLILFFALLLLPVRIPKSNRVVNVCRMVRLEKPYQDSRPKQNSLVRHGVCVGGGARA